MHKLPAGDPQGADHVSKRINLAFNFYPEQSIPPRPPHWKLAMRNNQPVTQREYQVAENQRLISTTDRQGVITYCNQTLIEVSGFSREELLNAPHNLVRHPDTPPAVFAHMWATLNQGKPWMGIVKNRRKNGDFYWVNAYVTPIYENNQVVGFESVRVKATAKQASRANTLYQRLNSGKPAIASSHRVFELFSHWLPFLTAALLSTLIGNLLPGSWGYALSALLIVPLGLAGVHWQSQGMRRLTKVAERANADPLIAVMYTDTQGAEARVEMSMLSQQAHLRTCLTRLQDTAEHLTRQAGDTGALAHRSAESLENQRQETEQVAAAVNQMAATTQEVAGNVQHTADATQKANELTQQGRKITDGARDAINRLATAVAETGETVTRLAQDSSEIGGVVDVIKGIADQTNLLALNAAIEAARAGEMGRGFAVVADEVRSLAQRTGESTGQIHQLIAKLQRTAQEAVLTMENGQRQAQEGVAQVQQADNALAGISDAVGHITDMANQIAAATEEQSAVAEEVNRKVITIAQLTEQTAEQAEHTAELSNRLLDTAQGQFSLVERFNR